MKTKIFFLLAIFLFLTAGTNLSLLSQEPLPDTVWTKDLWQLGSTITQVQFTPDQQNVAVAIGDGVYIYNLITQAMIKKFDKNMITCNSFCFSEDGSKIIIASNDNKIIVWDYNTGDTIRVNYLLGIQQIKKYNENFIIGITAWNSDSLPYLNIIEIPSGSIIRKVQLGDGEYFAISKENNLLSVINYHNGIRDIELWDLTTLTKIATLGSHSSHITDLSFSSNGKYLASASSDGIIKIWNIESKTLLKSLSHTSMQDGYLQIEFSPNNGFFVSSGGTGYNFTTKIWKVADFNITYNYSEPLGAQYGFKISRDSTYLAITGGNLLFLLKAKWNTTGLNDEPLSSYPKIYPNPNNNLTNIEFYLEIPEDVKIELLGLSGNLIDNIFSGFLEQGNKILPYDCSKIANGIYLIRIVSPSFIKTFKLVKEG